MTMLRLAGLLLTVVAAGANELHEMVMIGDAGELERLVTAGVDINAKGQGGQTPLLMATLQGQKACVEALLDLGADVTIPEKDGYTVMHAAAFQGRAEIASLFISRGISPRSKHADGYEPIHRACWGYEQRHTDTLRVFLDAGVPPDAAAANGATPLSLTTPGTPSHALVQQYINPDENL